MKFTRRQFVKGGVTAFTVGFAAPQFLADLAFAQSGGRNLVVLYLGGGNDALSTLVPYRDPAYYSRRPVLAVPEANLRPTQVGTDSAGNELALHPRLTDLKAIFDQGRLAIIQRTGYQNSSRSHFQGFDIWGTANPSNSQGTGWLGRYLDTLPSPIDPLVAWNTTRETPRALMARTVGVPAITNPATYSFSSPNSGTDATLERAAAVKISSHVPVDRPHLAFVNSTAQAALGTLDRVATVASYTPSVTYPNNGLAQALRAVAGAMVRSIGTKVFWVQTGGYDTHAGQGANAGAYVNLMATVNDSIAPFYVDLSNRGLLGSTLVIVFSEFGRRVSENGSGGTDHGAAGLMMAIGGTVRGGLYGTAANLRQDPGNEMLEPSGNTPASDVRFETDFRAVYAKVIDSWLGADSVSILGGDFKASAPNFL
jgi:uncharacterized protein (DUF1501 family)